MEDEDVLKRGGGVMKDFVDLQRGGLARPEGIAFVEPAVLDKVKTSPSRFCCVLSHFRSIEVYADDRVSDYEVMRCKSSVVKIYMAFSLNHKNAKPQI